VEASTSLPLQYVEIHSVFVRGNLGKMTVWTSDTGEKEKKFWKRESERTVRDEETGEEKTVFTEFDVASQRRIIDENGTHPSSEYLDEEEEREYGVVDRYTTNGGYHRQQLWKKVFEDELAPSRRKLVELTLDEPIRVERGRRVGIYIHSAERGDQGIVYDNVAELRPRAKRDGRVIIHPGVAHLSFKPFGRSAPWGGISLRRGRQFVGKLGYAVRWMLWSEVNHRLFPIGYKQAVKELIKGNQLDEECALSILPPEIMFAVLNKSCGWDWFGPQMRKIKKQGADGKSLIPEIEWSETCGREGVDQSLLRSSRRFQQGTAGWVQVPREKREDFARALKIFKHLMHEEYVVKLEKRLAISVSSDEDEDLEDDDDEKEEEEEEKSESELDGDYVSSDEARELSENVEEREGDKDDDVDDGKRRTRASTKAKKAKKAAPKPRRLTKEEKIENAIESRYARIHMLDVPLREFVLHHTLDNLARELETLDLLIEEGFCDSKDEVDRFLTHAQMNQTHHGILDNFHSHHGPGGGSSRKSALEELVEMNGGRRIEFENGSNISGLYDDDKEDDGDGNMNEKPSSRSIVDVEYVAHERMPGSIMRTFERDLSNVHGSHVWYGNHGPSLGGLGGAFEGEEYSSSEEEGEEEEEEEYDEDYDEEDYDEDYDDTIIEEEELAAAASGEFDFI